MQELRNFVDGQFVDGSAEFDKVGPVDGSVVAWVHEAGAMVVDRAVRSAQRALEGPWASLSVNDRAQLRRRATPNTRSPR